MVIVSTFSKVFVELHYICERSSETFVPVCLDNYSCQSVQEGASQVHGPAGKSGGAA